MLEITDYKVTGPIHASAGSVCLYEVEVPPNRGNTTGGTRFVFSDRGANGVFHPKDVLLAEGEGKFSFTYKPRKRSNAVISIKSSEDVAAPYFRTLRVTELDITAKSLVQHVPYRFRVSNPQAIYNAGDTPFVDSCDSLQSQQVLDHNTVELYGVIEKTDKGYCVFTDTQTLGAHSVRLDVMDEAAVETA